MTVLPQPSQATGTIARFLLLASIFALASVLIFLPGLPGAFVFDDFHNIVNNPAVHLTQISGDTVARLLATQQVSGATRSLPMLSFAVDYWRAGGPDPMVFKTTNLLIHATTAFALAWFFRSLLLAAGGRGERVFWLAPVLALAWAAHPLQVSAVLYTVQRIQTMGTLFLVLALLTYLQARQAQLEGRSGRSRFLLTTLLWALAMGCKEDSALFPAYTLALEVTVLRFAAAHDSVAKVLRRGYLLAAVAGIAAYVFFVIPHFWHWETIPGRDFSTLQRLLTQPRVLCMYLWQILVPLPRNMPFYYDWLEPSGSLLQPWTTLPAIAATLGLLGLAVHLRTRKPLFALGVLLFFASHFIASNVVNLELAFEHRNNFALIGVILALGGALIHTGEHHGARPVMAGVCLVVLAALAAGTIARASTWGSAAGIARAGTEAAPNSGRAWVELCAANFKAGGGAVPNNSKLDAAITICSQGAQAAPRSLNSLTLLVVLKTLRGDATPADWARLQQRMRTVHMDDDNTRVFLILVSHAKLGVELDQDELLATLDILVTRGNFGPVNRANLGYFVMNDLGRPDRALPYFLKSINARPAQDPFALQLSTVLRDEGRFDLAEVIEGAWRNRHSTLTITADDDER